MCWGHDLLDPLPPSVIFPIYNAHFVTSMLEHIKWGGLAIVIQGNNALSKCPMAALFGCIELHIGRHDVPCISGCMLGCFISVTVYWLHFLDLVLQICRMSKRRASERGAGESSGRPSKLLCAGISGNNAKRAGPFVLGEQHDQCSCHNTNIVVVNGSISETIR